MNYDQNTEFAYNIKSGNTKNFKTLESDTRATEYDSKRYQTTVKSRPNKQRYG